MLPTYFDWKYYINMHQDLQDNGIKSKKDAERHYLKNGVHEKRVYADKEKVKYSLLKKCKKQLKNIQIFDTFKHSELFQKKVSNDINISVVITNYNYGKYLDRCITSVIKNTYKNIEIVVVDDCSSDDSLDILKKYYISIYKI